jgi:hypothetical protein
MLCYADAKVITVGRHNFTRILWMELTACPPSPQSSFSKGIIPNCADNNCIVISQNKIIHLVRLVFIIIAA